MVLFLIVCIWYFFFKKKNRVCDEYRKISVSPRNRSVDIELMQNPDDDWSPDHSNTLYMYPHSRNLF